MYYYFLLYSFSNSDQFEDDLDDAESCVLVTGVADKSRRRV